MAAAAVSSGFSLATTSHGDGVDYPSTPTAASNRLSSAVATKAFFYVSAFLLTYSLDVAMILSDIFFGHVNVVLGVMAYILYPLMGVFNFLIFSHYACCLNTPEARALRWLLCPAISCRLPNSRQLESSKTSSGMSQRPDTRNIGNDEVDRDDEEEVDSVASSNTSLDCA